MTNLGDFKRYALLMSLLCGAPLMGQEFFSIAFLPPTTASASSPPATSPVRVFYVTDRRAIVAPVSKETYSAERSADGSLSYGSCVVSIPRSHVLGVLEEPGLFEFSEDATKHVILQKVESYTDGSFYNLLRGRISGSDRRDAFLFIHGYNTSFQDAARRTAQIAYDLKFQGAPMFYSWPSQGKASRYLVDETNADWTVPHLLAFLKELRSRSGAQRVHIIAHSMGARILTKTMDKLNADAQQVMFNQIILAAPDIDRDTFLDLARAMNWRADRVTLYASSRDKALKASKAVHGYLRAGESGDELVTCPGIDTIDATSVETDFFGHSYFAARTVLSDLFWLLRFDLPPPSRFGIYTRMRDHTMFWVFNP